MSAVLWVLLWILVAVIGTALALLGLVILVPFNACAEGDVGQDGTRGRIRLAWAWRLFEVRIEAGKPSGFYLVGLRLLRFSLAGLARPHEKEEKAKKKHDSKKPKRSEEKKKGRLTFEQIPVLLRMGLRMLRPLAPSGRFEGTLGTGDPGDTAVLMEVLRQIDQRTSRLELDICPSYVDATAELSGRVWMRIWLAHLGAVAIGLLFVRENRRALLALR